MAETRGLVVGVLVSGVATTGEAGSQQQPPPSGMGQQQPARFIWAARSWAVVVDADATSAVNSTDVIATRATGRRRDSERVRAMDRASRESAAFLGDFSASV